MSTGFPLGIDVGGSGIKGAPVDLDAGDFTIDRYKLPTPEHSTPEAVCDVIAEIVEYFEDVKDVSFSGNEIRAEFLGHRNKLADLNRFLVEKGVRVVSIKETEVDLENVFLAVTGKDRKEEAAKAAAKPAAKS